MRSFKRFAKLPTADQLLVLQALLLVAAMWIALHMLPFSRSAAPHRNRAATIRRESPSEPHYLGRCCRQPLLRGRCPALPQALAAHVLLGPFGSPVQS